jgi:ABC-type multidrug transport system fused ATPase/permease subunit
LQHSFAALERVFEIMNLVPEYEGEAGRVKASKINGGVRFDNVSFSYDKQRPALEGVSFESTTGQLIAIVGPSGAGKSTLVNLMMSLYEPCSGQIYFDGIPASQFTPQSLRERIGIVSQEIFLFNDTVKNNIRYGRTGASEEEVISAARSAGAHEFISQLPEGYQTTIGERGVMLSVGEKQRLSIARAILKDPDILILDEATSALDAATEQTVRDMLERYRRGKTVFAIAHRLSTVALSDFILVLDKGRIVQSGTHERLRNQEGLYRQLCQTQLLSLDQPAIQGQKSQNAGRILRG